MSGNVVFLSGQWLAGGTLQYTGQFLQPNGDEIPDALDAITEVTLTLCDTNSRQIINDCDDDDIYNTGRGVVDDEGNLTINLEVDDMVMISSFPKETHSMILKWAYLIGSVTYYGIREVQFLIFDSSPG